LPAAVRFAGQEHLPRSPGCNLRRIPLGTPTFDSPLRCGCQHRFSRRSKQQPPVPLARSVLVTLVVAEYGHRLGRRRTGVPVILALFGKNVDAHYPAGAPGVRLGARREDAIRRRFGSRKSDATPRSCAAAASRSVPQKTPLHTPCGRTPAGGLVGAPERRGACAFSIVVIVVGAVTVLRANTTTGANKAPYRRPG